MNTRLLVAAAEAIVEALTGLEDSWIPLAVIEVGLEDIPVHIELKQPPRAAKPGPLAHAPLQEQPSKDVKKGYITL